MTTTTARLTHADAIALVRSEYAKAGSGDSTRESVAAALAPLHTLTVPALEAVARECGQLYGRTKAERIATLVSWIAKRSSLISRNDFVGRI
jgi:hypothetical protein